MRKSRYIIKIFFSGLIIALAFVVHAQENGINNQVVSFKKQELNSGLVFDLNSEREELRTDESRYFEELTLMNAKFRFENRFWNLLDFKQEQLDAVFEIGPFGGYGNWVDSSFIQNTEADHNLFGIRTSARIAYLNRFYYDPKNYTLIDISGWGRYDLYKQKSEGTTIDSLGVSSIFDEEDNKDRLRFGFQAKAGWGFGRLSPMNHLMAAHYLLKKYYPRRVFSDYEIAQFAQVIANIKHGRNIKTGYNTKQELELLEDFLNNKMLLELPDDLETEWQFGEFNPRYEGRRLEIGPFFKYYNREPDFVYGAYFQYENSKYQNVNWNRNFSANLNYNRYKKQDWMLAEIALGWGYYSKLKSQFDFGVRYVPGIEINGFEDVGPLSHNLVPYFGYFTQLTSKARVNLEFAWRIADGEQFMLPGPEFSLAIYRSRY
ncbi:MAG: hypothetical protein ABFS16_11370 [Bacteroidota bacterium]